MRLVGILWLATACSFRIAAGTSDGAPGDELGPAEAGTDGLIVPPDGVSAFGDVDLMPALEEYAATGNWTVDDVTIDTGALSSTVTLPSEVTLTAGVQNNGGAVAILRVHDFKLNSGRIMRVVGTRPFVLIADHDVNIEGTLDVGARAEVPGAGGFGPALGPGAGGNGVHVDPNDDGGGGGGGFGGIGGAGGLGGAGGTGGAVGPTYPAATLVGGSGGGGPPQGITCTNLGGAGGGAVLVFAKHKLTVNGAITAGGGGGSAGILCPSPAMYASGAGGGAGGMIYLQSPDLAGNGILAANGGGGGGGACATGIPSAGQDASASTTNAAAGGNGTQCGSAGGNGATASAAPGSSSAAMYNGGGGGGGVGQIFYRAPDLATIKSSPAAITP